MTVSASPALELAAAARAASDMAADRGPRLRLEWLVATTDPHTWMGAAYILGEVDADGALSRLYAATDYHVRRLRLAGNHNPPAPAKLGEED